MGAIGNFDSLDCGICGRSLDEGPHLAVVIPIYKSEDHLPGLIEYITRIDSKIPGGVTATFVIDGSPQNERTILPMMLSTIPFPLQIIRLSRNFAVGPALHAALTNSAGCASVVFGADLQEPHELFVTFAEKILTKNVDVTLGQRISRADPFLMRAFSNFYWWVNRTFLNNDTPKGGFDVFGLSRRAREALIALPELNTNIASQLQWIGFDREYVPFHRVARQSGKSSWTMKKKIKLFADSIFGFSGAPITVIFLIGLFSVIGFGFLSAVTIIASLLGWISLPGYTTLVLLGAIGHSATLLACGIIGGYIVRAFENSKGRPRFIIADILKSDSFKNADFSPLESE